jgi:hypothetical protein
MTRDLPRRAMRALAVVAEDLPAHEFTIRRLILADPSFRDLCEEFADARQAQAARPRGNGVNDVVYDDWQEIVERLTAEILSHIKDLQKGGLRA